MKQVTIIIAILSLSISFSFTNTYPSKPIIKRNSQKELFDAIKSFAADVSSMDVSRLKKHFQFPVKDSGIWYLTGLDESLFYNKSSNKFKPFSEEDFNKYCKTIFSQPPCNLLSLFKTLKLDSLAFNPEIETYSDVKANEPCYYHYGIRIDEDSNEILFRYGTTSRADASGDGYMKCNEFTNVLTFKLVNGVLIFESLVIAG